VTIGSTQVVMELKPAVTVPNMLPVECLVNLVGDPLRVRVFTENFEVDRTERMGS